MQIPVSDVKVGPHKSLLRSITTFKELDRYVGVLIDVLDYIDRFVGHPFFTDYSENGIFRITKNTHGVEGHDFKLLKFGVEVACIGYYNLEPDDSSWAKCYDEGHTHIYAFRHNKGESTIAVQGNSEQYVDIPYNIDDYNETMYDQLEFMYSKEQVNISMCVAKIMNSDTEREYRQFVIYENNLNYYENILQELKDFVFHKTMLKGGFE